MSKMEAKKDAEQTTQTDDRPQAPIQRIVAALKADHAARSAKLDQASLGENAKTVTLGMAVLCSDGKAGSLERVVGDPETHEPAYLVVRLNPAPAREAVVPINLVTDVVADGLKLNATTGALQAYPDYEKTVTKYQPLTAEEKEQALATMLVAPAVDIETFATVTLRERTVPEHMVDLRKGMTVYDRHGLKLGELEGVIVDAETRQATWVVLRAPIPLVEERRLVPVDLIAFIIRSDVYLRVSVDHVAGLPLAA